jgi:putative membrane protein
MGMYDALVDAFKNLEIMVLVPIAIGGLVCVLAFSKLVDLLFNKAYTGLFHVILGVVIASTLMIIPIDFNYLSLGTLVCVATCAAGAALGYWMSRLEDKYKPEKI